MLAKLFSLGKAFFTYFILWIIFKSYLNLRNLGKPDWFFIFLRGGRHIRASRINPTALKTQNSTELPRPSRIHFINLRVWGTVGYFDLN